MGPLGDAAVTAWFGFPHQGRAAHFLFPAFVLLLWLFFSRSRCRVPPSQGTGGPGRRVCACVWVFLFFGSFPLMWVTARVLSSRARHAHFAQLCVREFCALTPHRTVDAEVAKVCHRSVNAFDGHLVGFPPLRLRGLGDVGVSPAFSVAVSRGDVAVRIWPRATGRARFRPNHWKARPRRALLGCRSLVHACRHRAPLQPRGRVREEFTTGDVLQELREFLHWH